MKNHKPFVFKLLIKFIRERVKNDGMNDFLHFLRIENRDSQG